MSRSVAACCVVLLCSLPGSASAFSPILNVNQWTAEELAREGIRVRVIGNPMVNTNPPLEWIEIEFDARSIAVEENVLMTVWQIGADRSTIGAVRTERKSHPDGKMTLTLAVRDEDLLSNSRFEVWIRDPAKTEPRGYYLQLARLVELARLAAKSPKDNPAAGRKSQGNTRPVGGRGPSSNLLRLRSQSRD